MRVAGIVRPDAATRPGGDLVQVERTAAALQPLGIALETIAGGAPDVRGYDLAHVFGVFEPEVARRQIDAVRRAKIPLVLSPIWLDLRPFFALAPRLEHALAASGSRVERRLARVRRLNAERTWYAQGYARERRLRDQRDLMARADVLIAASETEAYLYGERLHLVNAPIAVAPLGVDARAAARDSSAGARPRAGVLCAARVEPKKNQAALLYALREVDVAVTIVGDTYDERYLALCRRWATPRTRFVAHLPQPQLFALMREAAVHAHPSWFESPGLASVEAAAAGMRIVTGARGTEREYFGSGALYADPADPQTIRDAVVRALALGPRSDDDELARRLRAQTWERCAEATAAAYRTALAG